MYVSGDQLIKALNPDGSSIEYQYDTMGNRTAIIIDTDTTKYTFDKLNRLKTVTDPDGGVTSYTYDANGNRASVTYPNGTVAEYTYDSLNRLTKLFNHKSNGDTISCYTYTLGPAGNRVKVTEHTGRTVQYTYDATYKLVEEKIDDPDFGIRTISYTYDPVGNRLTKNDDGVVTNYTYDNNDRLLTENNITYSYDNNGNTILKVEGTDSTRYEYDFENRLIKVKNGSDVIEYTYDTDGMRVQKTVNGNITKFLLDKNRDYAQVLREYDNSGRSIVDYIYGDDLISQKRGSLKSYYHYDGQLSTRQLTDSSSQVTDTYTYDAFGILINRSGATENNYLYTGEQYDPNCGFYYLRARYYNESIGRFLTMDTFPGMEFEPASLHRYLYCESNPVGRWDASGEYGISLVEFSTAIFVRTILASVVTVTFGHLISIAYTPAEWSGNYTVFTSQWGNPYWGFGFMVVSLSGIHESEKGTDTGYGLYLIIMSGFTIGDPVNASWSTIDFISPGIFRANPFTLVGPVVFISGAWTWPVWAGIGGGFGSTVMTMGMGFTPKAPVGVIFGKDRGIDFMAGISLPLNLDY